MTQQGSYRAKDYHRDLESELARLQVQLNLTWKKEARNLKWFGVEDGMSVIELGSGPGFGTEKLLKLLPNSEITTVEIDPEMVLYSQAHLSNDYGERCNIIEGSAIQTGLANNSFDVAIARLIFQHLPEPILAAEEIYRVLKPGGKLIITDVDEALFWVFEPPLPESALISDCMSQGQAAQGGNRQIGRKIGRMMKQVGFQNIETEAITTNSDDLGMEPFMTQLDPDLLLPLVQGGLLSVEQLNQIRTSREAFMASAEPYVLLMWFMFCGMKPVNV